MVYCHEWVQIKDGTVEMIQLKDDLSETVGDPIHLFDGSDARGDDEGGGRVEVRYSRPPQKADDLIRTLVEDRVERVDRLTVVTSDLEVARHARAMGAEIALADLFLSSLLGPAGGASEAPEKPASISKKELEEWAAVFRGRKPDDASEADS